MTLFGLKEGGNIRSQEKLHNEELQGFYSSPNIIRIIE
jgi:hypothetical protein